MLPTNTHVFSNYMRLLHTHPPAYHHPCIQQEMMHSVSGLSPRLYDRTYAAGILR